MTNIPLQQPASLPVACARGSVALSLREEHSPFLCVSVRIFAVCASVSGVRVRSLRFSAQPPNSVSDWSSVQRAHDREKMRSAMKKETLQGKKLTIGEQEKRREKTEREV